MPFTRNVNTSSCSGATVHDLPWPLLWLLSLRPAAVVKSFSTVKAFAGWGRQPHAQPPTWRARVSLFVWIITFDLSGMGDPTSSYATAGITLRIIWPRKPYHYVKVGIPTGAYRKLLLSIYILLRKINVDHVRAWKWWEGREVWSFSYLNANLSVTWLT
jgi:hypothetical protein